MQSSIIEKQILDPIIFMLWDICTWAELSEPVTSIKLSAKLQLTTTAECQNVFLCNLPHSVDIGLLLDNFW